MSIRSFLFSITCLWLPLALWSQVGGKSRQLLKNQPVAPTEKSAFQKQQERQNGYEFLRKKKELEDMERAFQREQRNYALKIEREIENLSKIWERKIQEEQEEWDEKIIAFEMQQFTKHIEGIDEYSPAEFEGTILDTYLKKKIRKGHVIDVLNINNPNYLTFQEQAIWRRKLFSFRTPASPEMDKNLFLAHIFPRERENLAPLAYSDALYYKGYLLNDGLRIGRWALADSCSVEKYFALKGCRHSLARQMTLPFNERDWALQVKLEKEEDSLKNDLARALNRLGDTIRQVSWRDVQNQLHQGEAAIEFVCYSYNERIALAANKNPYAALINFNLLLSDTKKWYGALVLKYDNVTPNLSDIDNVGEHTPLLPSTISPPRFVPLCESGELDSLIKQAGRVNLEYQPKLYYNNLYLANSGLYKMIWAPLEPYLTGVHTIYYSSSGLLHRINPRALQLETREVLDNYYQMIGLVSTRNLVTTRAYSPANNSAVLFGGIFYEMDSLKLMQSKANFHRPSYPSPLDKSNGLAPTTNIWHDNNLEYLPGTNKEVISLNNLLRNCDFQPNLFRGYNATEEAFWQVCQEGSFSPRIIHIATHGFFFPDPKESNITDYEYRQSDEPAFQCSDDPMIRSGLLLAGANYAWKTGKPFRPSMEDGILTAYEISQMDLHNTELVVLSACETGLGQIAGDEGVYGLQRAFKIAGAKYLLMSLWKVPDGPTQELMQDFYEQWLDKGKSIPKAFRAAQAQLRAKYSNPYFWAGFVLLE